MGRVRWVQTLKRSGIGPSAWPTTDTFRSLYDQNVRAQVAPGNGMGSLTAMPEVVVNNTDDQGGAWFSIETGLSYDRVTLTTPVGHFDLTAGSAIRMAGGLLLGIASLGAAKIDENTGFINTIEGGFQATASYLASIPSVFEVGVAVAALLCGSIPTPVC